MHVNRIDEIDESLAGSEFVVRNNGHLPDPLNVHAHALMRGSRSNCWKRRGGRGLHAADASEMGMDWLAGSLARWL